MINAIIYENEKNMFKYNNTVLIMYVERIPYLIRQILLYIPHRYIYKEGIIVFDFTP